MSNIWLDPFGISLIKSKQSKHNPPPPDPPAPASEEPQVQVHYTSPCYQFQMPQQFLFYNVNTNAPFCNQVRPVAPQCHCKHKKPDDKKKKPDDKKKKPAAPKKPVDEKKKKKEEEEKKKALALAKEKEDRKNVVPTFCNPRTPRKGVFER